MEPIKILQAIARQFNECPYQGLDYVSKNVVDILRVEQYLSVETHKGMSGNAYDKVILGPNSFEKT